MTPVALRPATPGHSEFCYHLHKAWPASRSTLIIKATASAPA